jgi:hypothetical protein
VAGSPLKRLQTCQKLGERIGFGEIVVAAGAQSLDAVLGSRHAAEHQHRRPSIALAETAHQGQPVEPRHFPIKHEGVENPFLRHCQGHGAVDGVTAFRQSLNEITRRSLVVFGHENAQLKPAAKLKSISCRGDGDLAGETQTAPMIRATIEGAAITGSFGAMS